MRTLKVSMELYATRQRLSFYQNGLKTHGYRVNKSRYWLHAPKTDIEKRYLNNITFVSPSKKGDGKKEKKNYNKDHCKAFTHKRNNI